MSVPDAKIASVANHPRKRRRILWGPGDPDPEMYIRKITLRVPDDLHDSLKRVARARGFSMNELGMRILHHYLAAHDPDPVHDWLDEEHARHDRSKHTLLQRAGRTAP